MAMRIAAVQAAPVLLDRAAIIENARELIRQAAKGGASLVVFPEAFVPGYPLWVWAIPPRENQLLTDLYGKLVAEAVAVPGPAIDLLAEAAQEMGVYVAIGVNETNVEASGATLYNTLVYLGPDGRLIGKHRKLVPTAAERMVWSRRWQHARRVRYPGGKDRRADLLGELHAAGALCDVLLGRPDPSGAYLGRR